MKKLLALGAFALFGMTVSAQQNAIKANPLALLGGSDLVTYERAIGDQSSIVVGGGIGGYKFGGFKYSTFGGGLQYRYYFDEALRRWYAGGIADFTSGTVESNSSGFGFTEEGSSDEYKSEADVTNFGIGAKIGYQWLFDSGFLIDINVGASYKKFDYKYSDSSDEAAFNGIKAGGVLPTFGFALGYAF